MLKVNLRVEIEVLRGSYRGKYPSQVEEILPDRFSVSMPIFRGYYVPIPRGTRIWVSYVKDRAVYYLETEVLERHSGTVPHLVLALPDKVERVQRRHFVRFEVSLPAAYQVLPEEGKAAQPGEPVVARTADISGGGLLLVTRENLSPGTRLALIISLPRVKIKAEGKVARLVQTQERRGVTEYFLGVGFTTITDWDQDKIIGYIFEEQRKLRWKGLYH
ncbi:MAG: flagellar brake domain-containing protein [Firmicutes bacterium]|nr:flagellar brake domain-containing protein [Bacillota bacterium]